MPIVRKFYVMFCEKLYTRELLLYLNLRGLFVVVNVVVKFALPLEILQ